jgi:Domain of unknown function (DUF4158)
VAARAWACEDGPRALFDWAVLWLIEHRVLLPGITVLARLVAGVRASEHERFHERLAAAVPEGLAARHEKLLIPDVPPVKVAGLARYGLSATAPALRELSSQRRTATLLATVRQLEIDAVDDALDLFDLLMATKLLAMAEKLGNKAKLRTLPTLRRAAVKIAAAVAVLLDIPPAGASR